MHSSLAGTQQKFEQALNALIDNVKRDRSVLAAILCGSLAHDTVWDKSDIDLVLVTVDEKKRPEDGLALYAGGVNVHALLMPRAEFRKLVEGSLRNSFGHSLLAKGRLIYTHDETIGHLCEKLHSLGERDLEIQLMNAASSLLPPLYKAHKWLRTRGDLEYTALWILYAATPLARIELLRARRLVDREVIPQAIELNPPLFKIIYSDLLNMKKTPKNVQAALSAIDTYLAGAASKLFAPLIGYLREIGEARSITEIDDHFLRNFGIRDVTIACEYLADRGLIGKTGLPVRLTKRSNVEVEELAFFHSAKSPDAW